MVQKWVGHPRKKRKSKKVVKNNGKNFTAKIS